MSLQLLSSEYVATQIESLVQIKRLSYLDAVIYFCDTRKMDPVDLAPYLSDKIKSELSDDAQRLHLLPRTTRLPL